MDTERQQELISAYLDGEVTADEKRTVEALLAASDEARQLLAELRGLQTRVRELPKFSLGADFSQSVLDQAERTMIAGTGTRSAVAASAAAAAAAGNGDDWDDTDGTDGTDETDETGDDHDLHVFYSEQDKADRAAVFKRRIVWSGLAVAAALLIMVLFPQQDPENIAWHDPATKSADQLAKADRTGAEKAIEGTSGKDLSVGAADEATDKVAMERKRPLAGPRQGRLLKSPDEAAEAQAADGAPAASASLPLAGQIGRSPADPVDKAAAAGSAFAAPALGVVAEAEPLQIAAGYDGVWVFEIDQLSFADVNGLVVAPEADAPAADAGPRFRALPLEKLADRRKAPVADEVEADAAKAKGDSAEQVYWHVFEGTSDQIELALAKLRAPASHYQAVEMKPQFAESLRNSGGVGGGSLAPVDARAVGDAKRQSARPDRIEPIADEPIADAEAPAAGAVAASPSKPAPAPTPPTAPADGAAGQLDKAETRNKRRQVDGAPKLAANRDGTQPSAPLPPAATPAATEIDGLAGTNAEEEAEELVKRVVRLLAKTASPNRLRSQRELQEPFSEAAAVADNKKASNEEEKTIKQEAAKEATDQQVQPQAPSRPLPVAEPGAERPLLQRSQVKDTVAEKTYRVLVVVSVK